VRCWRARRNATATLQSQRRRDIGLNYAMWKRDRAPCRIEAQRCNGAPGGDSF
jgi:hypothetical protein